MKNCCIWINVHDYHISELCFEHFSRFILLLFSCFYCVNEHGEESEGHFISVSDHGASILILDRPCLGLDNSHRPPTLHNWDALKVWHTALWTPLMKRTPRLPSESKLLTTPSTPRYQSRPFRRCVRTTGAPIFCLRIAFTFCILLRLLSSELYNCKLFLGVHGRSYILL